MLHFKIKICELVGGKFNHISKLPCACCKIKILTFQRFRLSRIAYRGIYNYHSTAYFRTSWDFTMNLQFKQLLAKKKFIFRAQRDENNRQLRDGFQALSIDEMECGKSMLRGAFVMKSNLQMPLKSSWGLKFFIGSWKWALSSRKLSFSSFHFCTF